MMQEAIKAVIARHDFSREEAREIMQCIMSGDATPAQIGAFVVAEKLKGETYQEVAGFAEAMRENATEVKTRRGAAVDLCGTGGDGRGTFNISTVASFVVAAGGVPVAKHGNRSVSSRCGSADLLEALGVKIDLDAGQMGACLDELGLAFLYAPALHPAMRHAVGPRREIGVRTVFNILGPLTNPARVRRQLLGVYDAALAPLMAAVLRELGADHVWVIHSEDGLDEISIHAPTRVVELKDGEIREHRLEPETFGLNGQNGNGILGGTPEENARIALDVLQGKPGPARDVVLVNAACGFLVGGRVEDVRGGLALAQEMLDSGAALDKLHGLVRITNDKFQIKN